MNRKTSSGNDGEDDDSPDDRDEGHEHRMQDRNKFFVPPESGDGERRGGRVLAALEVPEPPGEDGADDAPAEPVLLECVDADWYFSKQPIWGSWLDVDSEAPLSVLELTEYALPQSFGDARPGDIAWFEIGYEPASEREANGRIYTSLFAGGQPVKVQYSERHGRSPVGPQEWAQGLPASSRLPWWSPVAAADAHTVLNSRLASLAPSAGVAIYDVGQGNCQALVEREFHTPILYVDLGGGVLYNRATFPKELRGLCFSQKPPVLLSHWDWDHWSSAYRFPEALNLDWIVRPVPDKPIQMTFAAALFRRGRLHVWKDSDPKTLRKGSVRIERCTGDTSNDSGLAVTFYAGKLRRRNCLLPGDAAYRHVPSVQSEKFSALCMTHHGGAPPPRPLSEGEEGCGCGQLVGSSQLIQASALLNPESAPERRLARACPDRFFGTTALSRAPALGGAAALVPGRLSRTNVRQRPCGHRTSLRQRQDPGPPYQGQEGRQQGHDNRLARAIRKP